MATGPSRVIDRLRMPTFPQDGGGFTDGQLLERFLTQRQEAAFAALVKRHGPMVLGVCRRVLGNLHDAEDAFQAAFLVLVRKGTSLLLRECIGNWLYGVAYHTALKARAVARKRRAKERQVAEMPKPDPLDRDAWQDLLPILDQELNRLPDKYREAVVLCDLEGKTRKRAAKQLQIPEGTLSTRLDRARAMLAKRMARHGLSLAGGSLAMLLSQHAASAGIPTSLAVSTTQAATLFAAGKVAAGVISANALTLTQGVLKTMFLTKLKITTAILLTISVVATGSVALTYSSLAAEPANSQKETLPKVEAKSEGKQQVVDIWQESATLLLREGEAYSLAFSPDGKTLACACSVFGKVELWDLKTNKVRTTIVGQPVKQAAYAQSVAFSPDGRKLALAGGTSNDLGSTGGPAWLRLVDLETQKQQEIDHGHTALIKSVVFSPDGKTLATGSWDFNVKFYDVATVKVRATIPQGPRGSVSGVAFSPDGNLLASANTDGTVKLWYVASAKEKASLGQPVDFFPIFSCVAFSPDGKTLAAGTWNREVKGPHEVYLFEVASGKERSRLQGHQAWIQSVAFAPDGKTLASASSDKTVKLWDWTSARELATLTSGTPAHHEYHFLAVTFSPDGKTLAAGGHGQTVKLWTQEKQPLKKK